MFYSSRASYSASRETFACVYKLGKSQLGKVRSGKAPLGKAWLGKAQSGKARLGKPSQEKLGQEKPGWEKSCQEKPCWEKPTQEKPACKKIFRKSPVGKSLIGKSPDRISLVGIFLGGGGDGKVPFLTRFYCFRDPESLPSSSYLVVQTPGDPIHGGAPSVHGVPSGSSAASQLSSPSGQPPPFGPAGQGSVSQGGKGTTVVRHFRLGQI